MSDAAPIHLLWEDFYQRTRALAEAYLAPSYDAVYYVMRGGMTPAHVLAHHLALPSGGEGLRPIAIRRHESDAVQAARRKPILAAPLTPAEPGLRLLLVEDTIGEGRTLEVAVQALERFAPARLDIFSVGCDHQDLAATHDEPGVAALVARAAIGFDYWGWMVFPWERDADAAPAPSPARRVAAPAQAEAPWASAIAEMVAARLADGASVRLAGEAVAQPVDLVLAPGLIASRSGLGVWVGFAREAARSLKPGGWLVFDACDRRAVRTQADLFAPLERYTPELLAALLTKLGYHEIVTAELDGRLSVRAVLAGAPRA